MNKQDFDADAFYEALEREVRTRSTSWRQVSSDTGVNATTLTRMSQGRRPDAASLAALSAWAGINPAEFVQPAQTASRPQAQTLNKVSLLFRQDPSLTKDARKTLENILETTYNNLRTKGAKD
jgi:transcriptional regulator with XRE-family HTH domain